ncbi:MAG: hypothetical protein IPO17_04225 [Flavobacteriales bacterium]|nr:hypothetical protein [Flavobacteriales bacterium]
MTTAGARNNSWLIWVLSVVLLGVVAFCTSDRTCSLWALHGYVARHQRCDQCAYHDRADHGMASHHG